MMAFKRNQKKLALNKVTISQINDGQMNGFNGRPMNMIVAGAGTMNYSNCLTCDWESECFSACCASRSPEYCPTYEAYPIGCLYL